MLDGLIAIMAKYLGWRSYQPLDRRLDLHLNGGFMYSLQRVSVQQNVWLEKGSEVLVKVVNVSDR